MEKRKITKSKVEGLSANKKKSGRFSVIVKVNKENYVPAVVAAVRQHISPYIFTAEATQDIIDQLEADKLVESVSISESLPMI